LKFVDGIRCSFWWHPQNCDTTDSFKDFLGAQENAKFFWQLRSKQLVGRNSLFGTNIIPHNLHLGLILKIPDPTSRKILVTPLTIKFSGSINTQANMSSPSADINSLSDEVDSLREENKLLREKNLALQEELMYLRQTSIRKS